MKPNVKSKKLTKDELNRIEVNNVDFYIDRYLVRLKNAQDSNQKHQVTRIEERLLELVVKRHYLDPKRKIPNLY